MMGHVLKLLPRTASYRSYVCRSISTSGAQQTELEQWVLSQGGKVTGATLANLAGADGGTGFGLLAAKVLAVHISIK